MSRIGKSIITLPKGVDFNIQGNTVTVKGPKGQLTHTLNDGLSVAIEDGVVTLSRENEEKSTRSLHGLNRALVANMVKGVSEGYKKEMELIGVGYRASNQGQKLDLSLGYSHNIILEVPKEVSLETKAEKGQNPQIILTSHDKELLGMVAAKIRSFRKPEPYKGKGIRFKGEQIRRKAGKSAGKK